MAGGGESTGGRVKHTYHIGGWGNPYEGGGQKGRGIIQYAMSANRQRPFVGFFTKGVWNTVRRAKNQILYVVPPFIVAYSVMHWAIERNEYLNSKAGRAEFGEGEE